MKKLNERMWVVAVSIGLMITVAAQGQQGGPTGNAPTAPKAVNINEIDVTDGLRGTTTTTFGGGFTGPVVGLGIANGGIVNTKLQTVPRWC